MPFVFFAHTPAEPVAAEPVAAEPVAAEPVTALLPSPNTFQRIPDISFFDAEKKIANFERPFTPQRWLRSA